LIVILKYRDNGKSIFAYNETSNIIDRIKINKLKVVGFPIFNLLTEKADGVTRKH